MVRKMNKTDFIKKLQEKTDYSEQKCILINDILENHFIIGRNNKEKIKKDFVEKLDITEEEADDLYNVCAEILVKGIFRRK